MTKYMNLQLFAEGEAAAGAAAPAAEAPGAPAEGGQETGVSASPTREDGRSGRIFPAVQKVQRTAAAGKARTRQIPAAIDRAQQGKTAPEQNAPQAEETAHEETFEEAISGRWKEEYGKRVQEAVQKRFKNQEDASAKLQSVMGVLNRLAPLYGMAGENPNDLDVEALAAKIQDNDSLYAEEAMAKGMPVSTYKQIKQSEIREAQQKAAEQRSLEERQLTLHVQSLRQQEAELKREYPDFDLMREAQNPAFARMTSPGGGLSVRQAYMALHGEELMQRAAAKAQEETKTKVSQAIRAGGMRPQENGMAQSGGGTARRDAKSYTREERAEIRRRVLAGERGIVP